MAAVCCVTTHHNIQGTLFKKKSELHNPTISHGSELAALVKRIMFFCDETVENGNSNKRKQQKQQQRKQQRKQQRNQQRNQQRKHQRKHQRSSYSCITTRY